jgi:hypothetical protein
MPPEAETVIDILTSGDSAVRSLLTIKQLARVRWQCTPAFAKRRLRAAGIHLVKVYGNGYPVLCVRSRDVRALEKALTIYLKPRE